MIGESAGIRLPDQISLDPVPAIFILVPRLPDMELRNGDIALLTDVTDESAGVLAELANDPSLPKYVGSHSFPTPYTKEAALDFIHLNRELFGKRFRIDFYIHFRGELCGVIEISDINHDDGNAHIGYWIAARFRGKGIATQSVRMVCSYSRDQMKLHKLHTRVLSFNTRSLSVLVANGFSIEGFLKDHFYLDGKYYAFYTMGKILEERE